MVKSWTIRWICLRIALIATLFQAITPDASDLASSLLFRMIDPLSAHGISQEFPRPVVGRLAQTAAPFDLAHDPIPWEDVERGSTPDETCPATDYASHDTLQPQVADSTHLVTFWHEQPPRPDHLGSIHRLFPFVRGITLLLALGRLTC